MLFRSFYLPLPNEKATDFNTITSFPKQKIFFILIMKLPRFIKDRSWCKAVKFYHYSLMDWSDYDFSLPKMTQDWTWKLPLT